MSNTMANILIGIGCFVFLVGGLVTGFGWGVTYQRNLIADLMLHMTPKEKCEVKQALLSAIKRSEDKQQ